MDNITLFSNIIKHSNFHIFNLRLDYNIYFLGPINTSQNVNKMINM